MQDILYILPVDFGYLWYTLDFDYLLWDTLDFGYLLWDTTKIFFDNQINFAYTQIFFDNQIDIQE